MHSMPSCQRKVGIFWDYENCCPPRGMSGSDLVSRIRNSLRCFGEIVMFKAYLEKSGIALTEVSLQLQNDLNLSGVSLTLCPPRGRKETADSMIVADLMAFAICNTAPAVVVMISGDADFSYALSLLNARQYTILVVVNNVSAPVVLRTGATHVLAWRQDILDPRKGFQGEGANAAPMMGTFPVRDQMVGMKGQQGLSDKNSPTRIQSPVNLRKTIVKSELDFIASCAGKTSLKKEASQTGGGATENRLDSPHVPPRSWGIPGKKVQEQSHIEHEVTLTVNEELVRTSVELSLPTANRDTAQSGDSVVGATLDVHLPEPSTPQTTAVKTEVDCLHTLIKSELSNMQVQTTVDRPDEYDVKAASSYNRAHKTEDSPHSSRNADYDAAVTVQDEHCEHLNECSCNSQPNSWTEDSSLVESSAEFMPAHSDAPSDDKVGCVTETSCKNDAISSGTSKEYCQVNVGLEPVTYAMNAVDTLPTTSSRPANEETEVTATSAPAIQSNATVEITDVQVASGPCKDVEMLVDEPLTVAEVPLMDEPSNATFSMCKASLRWEEKDVIFDFDDCLDARVKIVDETCSAPEKI